MNLKNRTRIVDRLGGFTLIELMIALAVLALLATIAVPSYVEQVERSRRSDALTGLLQLSNRLEIFYANQIPPTYTTNVSAVGYNVSSPEGHYDLSITAADAASYTIQAVPNAASPQQGDEECQSFTLDSFGRKTSSPDAADECWR